MRKYVMYNGCSVLSEEFNDIPYVHMGDLLCSAVPGSWDEYGEVLNASPDMVSDLGIIFVDGGSYVPVVNVSTWLYSFTLMSWTDCDTTETFRTYRREFEDICRVVWALPVNHKLTLKKGDFRDIDIPPNQLMYYIGSLFASFGVSEDQITGASRESELTGPLEYLECISSAKDCGSRGHAIWNQIQYIHDLPNSGSITSYIDQVLLELDVNDFATDYFDEFLDSINAVISEIPPLFLGEL